MKQFKLYLSKMFYHLGERLDVREFDDEPRVSKTVEYKEFVTEVAHIADEVGGDMKTKTGSHKLPPRLDLYCEDQDDDNDYEITMVDITQWPGCGCWDGIRIRFKKVK